MPLAQTGKAVKKSYDYRNFNFQTARKHGMSLPDPYEIFSVSYGDNDDEVAKAFDYIQTQGGIYFFYIMLVKSIKLIVKRS